MKSASQIQKDLHVKFGEKVTCYGCGKQGHKSIMQKVRARGLTEYVCSDGCKHKFERAYGFGPISR